MRKINAIITAGIILLFPVHLFRGVFMMIGIAHGGSAFFSAVSYLMLVLTTAHALIGCKLTFDTLSAIRRSGVSYPGQNRLFWIRRLSGLALTLFMAIHVWIFQGQNTDGVFLLRHYDTAAFATQILMVIALAVHLLTNIRPLKIAFGIEAGRNFRTDVLISLSAALLLSAIGFLLYLVRWRAL